MKSLTFLFVTLLICSHYIYADTSKPNIIIFMADDLGYGSINGMGASKNHINTPNLNSLMSEGLSFTNAFTTASVCSPTRYGVLTGRYSWRTQLKSGVVNSYDPMLISSDTMTIGQYLQNSGYRTAAVGKWHLGYKGKKFQNLLGKISPGPNDVGFNYHFGVPNNYDDIHKVYIENNHIFGLKSDRIQSYGKSSYGKPYTGYDAPQRECKTVMEFTTQKAIDWILQTKDQPFFMYFNSVGVHIPIIPSDRMKGTSGIGAYGDFIHDVDYSVGQFIKALRENGLDKNTLFIFTSDNGGDLPVGSTKAERIAYASGFRSNGNLRGDKHTIFEGGLKVPFIVKWPDQIKAGEVSNSLVSTVDIFCTLTEAVNNNVPEPKIAAPDSFSFYHLFKNPNAESKRQYLINRDAKGRQAIRKGRWKFVDNFFPGNGKSSGEEIGIKMLFDLQNDPTEQNNVLNKYPEVVKELSKLLNSARSTPNTRTR